MCKNIDCSGISWVIHGLSFHLFYLFKMLYKELQTNSVVYTKINTLGCLNYCRFGHFRENFIFANSIKTHISDVKNSRLRQDLSACISINESDFAIRKGEVSRK